MNISRGGVAGGLEGTSSSSGSFDGVDIALAALGLTEKMVCLSDCERQQDSDGYKTENCGRASQR